MELLVVGIVEVDERRERLAGLGRRLRRRGDDASPDERLQFLHLAFRNAHLPGLRLDNEASVKFRRDSQITRNFHSLPVRY